jgi:two-component system phosphate regulon sensor histidine kinase PhoR
LRTRIETITEDKNRMQAILSGMVEGVMAFDMNGRIVDMNKAATAYLGVDKQYAIGRTVEEVVRNPEFQQFIQNVLEGDQAPTQTELTLSQDGQRCLQLRGAPLNGGVGLGGAVIVLHDITQIRRTEQIRRDFVSNVSHELKTPITSIKGFVETLQEGSIDDPKEAKRFLDIIGRHADRLDAIIDDLLSLARLEEEGENRGLFFEESYLRPVLASALELAAYKAERKKISLTLQCDDTIALKMNAALVEQAVYNLIDNAIKYSDDNSEISITADRQNEDILISVRDSGCGIEEEHLPRLFERFYVVDKSRSRKLGGTGLGLSIVKHITQVHGGQVTVESVIHHGSTFTIHLPVGIQYLKQEENPL